MQDFIKKLIPVFKGEFLVKAPLRDYTTFRVGGPADFLIFPRYPEDIEQVMKLITESSLPVIMLGNGSNLLVKDEGFHGVAISLKRYFNSINIIGETIEVEAGAMLPALAHNAQINGLSGLEFAIGIPGTVGGAIHNNAGSFGQNMGNIVEEIELVDKHGDAKKINRKDLSFSYRKCILPISGIIVKALLNLKKDSENTILKKMQENVEKRNKIQPINYPSAGSIFKNPANGFAGRIIESSGLKGFVYGKAQISEKHANFIVNTGGAKASEIIYLIELIEKTVQEKMGIKLEREVEII
ncbi:UDP-N-acetylmuramate dehydrogenase [Candidatus Poribacteria bacterium]|nr:UDP-N-acetylmuramate dehydrogenase [Candidatus Poribacteria bacterium]